jgi:hypothetical protein
MINRQKNHLEWPVNPSIIYHFGKSCKGDKSEKFFLEKWPEKEKQKGKFAMLKIL